MCLGHHYVDCLLVNRTQPLGPACLRQVTFHHFIAFQTNRSTPLAVCRCVWAAISVKFDRTFAYLGGAGSCYETEDKAPGDRRQRQPSGHVKGLGVKEYMV
jgi:hypothetical protein